MIAEATCVHMLRLHVLREHSQTKIFFKKKKRKEWISLISMCTRTTTKIRNLIYICGDPRC